MLPNEKGWLTRYLEYRKDLSTDLNHFARKGSHPEHSLYRIIQRTGIMYGQTVGTLEIPIDDRWEGKDKMKILLAESFVSSSLLYHDRAVTNQEELDTAIEEAVDNIGKFYSNIFPETAGSFKTFFGKKKTSVEIAEKILEKRVEMTGKYEKNFWAYFFHNSLLFLDIFIFGQWIHTNADKIVADFFRYEREELRSSMVKVIAVASHANKELSFEERKLFELFLQSTDLSPEKKKDALAIFEQGIDVRDINLPAENSWILKKYFLEIAILTIWADKKVEDVELIFLKEFCSYLNFSEEDMENSMIAVEGFVLEHWEQLDYLQNRKLFSEVSKQFISRLASIAEKNETRLLKEIQSHAVLCELLKKAQSKELGEEEKEIMRKEFIHVLRAIPTFEIVSLPQQFLTLSNVMKVIPKRIFTDF